MMQTLTQPMAMLRRQWTKMLTMDNTANDDADTQIMGDNADDDDAAADVNAAIQTTR